MRTSIALVLFIAVVQLSVIGAFSPLMATKVVAPSGAKAKAKAPAKKAAEAPKKVAVKKAAPKKAATKAVPKAKGKAVIKARSKADVKAAAKAKADAKAKANAGLRAKQRAAEKKKAEEAAKAKAKALAKAKKTAANKKKLRTTTSATAANVANSGTDAALAITKGIKKANANNKGPLFPGLQSGTKKTPESIFKKKANDAPAKANNVVATKGSSDDGAVNPLEFGLQVVQSEKGQEAAAILVEGGLKFVEAILDEGKKTKVVIPRGFDAGTGDLKKPKVTNIGIKELIDAGIFAGTEFFGVAKSNYEKFYVGGEAKEQVKITRTAAKVDKSGRVLSPVKENYYVKIGGERVLITKKL